MTCGTASQFCAWMREKSACNGDAFRKIRLHLCQKSFDDICGGGKNQRVLANGLHASRTILLQSNPVPVQPNPAPRAGITGGELPCTDVTS